MTPACSDCGKQISAQSKTGRCRVCALRATHANPIAEARKIAAIRERAKDPEYRRKALRNLYIGHMRARRDPLRAERMSRGLPKARERQKEPDVIRKMAESRPRGIVRRRAKLLSWCPAEYHEEYRAIMKSRKMLRRDAKAHILAKLTPFERQMHAITQGRGLVAAFKAPDKDYGFTLGGVSPMAGG